MTVIRFKIEVKFGGNRPENWQGRGGFWTIDEIRKLFDAQKTRLFGNKFGCWGGNGICPRDISTLSYPRRYRIAEKNERRKLRRRKWRLNAGAHESPDRRSLEKVDQFATHTKHVPKCCLFSELTLGRRIALQNAKNQWGNQWDARGPTPRGLALHASSFRLLLPLIWCVLKSIFVALFWF